MSDLLQVPETQAPQAFVERRRGEPGSMPGRERRQFANSYEGLSPEAIELASAID